MKKIISILLAACVVSCTITHRINVPPGQAKKVTGSKSANPNAPGQQKKATGAKSAKPFAPGQKKKK